MTICSIPVVQCVAAGALGRRDSGSPPGVIAPATCAVLAGRPSGTSRGNPYLGRTRERERCWPGYSRLGPGAPELPPDAVRGRRMWLLPPDAVAPGRMWSRPPDMVAPRTRVAPPDVTTPPLPVAPPLLVIHTCHDEPPLPVAPPCFGRATCHDRNRRSSSIRHCCRAPHDDATHTAGPPPTCHEKKGTAARSSAGWGRRTADRFAAASSGRAASVRATAGSQQFDHRYLSRPCRLKPDAPHLSSKPPRTNCSLGGG